MAGKQPHFPGVLNSGECQLRSIATYRASSAIGIHVTIVEQLRIRKSALSVAELAKLLSMGTRTIYAGIKSGRIPSIRILGTVRLDPQQIAVWLEERSA